MSENWMDMGAVDAIPIQGARTVRISEHEVALFRAADGVVFALQNRCPHKGGPLSEGIVHGHYVACPLHNWVISLESGEAQGADRGCAPRIPVRIENGQVLMDIAAVRSRLETRAA